MPTTFISLFSSLLMPLPIFHFFEFGLLFLTFSPFFSLSRGRSRLSAHESERAVVGPDPRRAVRAAALERAQAQVSAAVRVVQRHLWRGSPSLPARSLSPSVKRRTVCSRGADLVRVVSVWSDSLRHVQES